MDPKLFIAVIHDKRFDMRLQTLNTLVSKFTSNFKVHIIEEHNADQLSLDEIRNHVKLENPETKTFLDALVRSMHVKQVSQAMKHYAALKAFCNQDTFDIMLVIEDDVLSSDNVVAELAKAIETFKSSKDTDIMFLGCPTPKSMIEKEETIANVTDYYKVLPTNDAYMIKLENAQKVRDAFLPIRFQTNIQFTYMAMAKDIKCKFMYPNIFVNGSKYGVYISSVDPNNRLFMNMEYNKLLMLNTKSSYSQEDVQQVVDMTTQTPLHEHPDFQYQFGIFFMRIGQNQQAKTMLDNAYRLYSQNDCILNNESEFLMNYSRCFRYFQTDRDAIEAASTSSSAIS